MTNDFDKELDSLLRGHTATARRDDVASASAASGDGALMRDDRASSAPVAQTASHLDADELNAYAENALPPSTRARYVAHLADCDSCRKIATGIALAAGVAVELEKRAAVPGHAASVATWRDRLAALFAPRLLRYVAPALALMLVGVVGFVALRQDNDLLATKQVETAGESPNTATTREPLSEEAKQSAPPSLSSSSPVTNSNEMSAKTTQPTTSAPGAVGSSASGAASQPARRSEITIDRMDSPVEMAAKKGGPPAAPAPEAFAVNKSEEPAPPPVNEQRDATRSAPQNSVTLNDENSRGSQTNAAQNNLELSRADNGDYESARRGQQRAESQSRSQNSSPSDSRSAEESVTTTSEITAPKPSAGREGRALGMGGRKRNASKEKKDAEDDDAALADATRTIAGRRFRRRGNAWVDMAYNASRSVTEVRRGSEQFRALIADDADLRRIADYFRGEIIVVSKNRAYRIR